MLLGSLRFTYSHRQNESHIKSTTIMDEVEGRRSEPWRITLGRGYLKETDMEDYGHRFVLSMTVKPVF